MSTDNGGLNGCVHFSDLNYVSAKGFAAIGDNGGHNSSAFDGTWALNNSENVVDWAYRACHESVAAGQELVSQFYAQKPTHSYYIGCSTARSPCCSDWSGRSIQLTAKSGSVTFLIQDQWILVQSKIFDQCDEPLDSVADGILEDPTICKCDASVLQCSGNNTNNCLTATQVSTVQKVFAELYDLNDQLIYPALLYGSEVDAYRLGQLSGAVQGITNDWSRFAFRSAGKKMIMHHGMADPLVSGSNSQRYYLKVAKTLGLLNTEIDHFMRYFRISGMAHCGVGGISGAGPWMFGQTGAAAVPGIADNIIDRLVDWVEKSKAPDVLTGTKFYYGEPSRGLQYIRSHCRFPYRTSYNGGDDTRAPGWRCKLIDNWQQCAARLRRVFEIMMVLLNNIFTS
ncbi:putative feruloyl esterase b-2 [Acrodontium crateriforme]|uniref:Carboxylic ester hydrolase n=1 Tax=Acrodontium crateriforme TaxID=150365 RepID=A0AAQ3R827_9PEZI|nr:putative feruloyl esterase b-2 [Acrodontium crateriforme]